MKGIFFLVSSLSLYLSFFVYLNRGENRIPVVDKSRTTRFASLLLLPAFVESMTKKKSLPLWDRHSTSYLFNSKISSAILLQELFQFGTKRPKVGFLHNHWRSKSNSLFSTQTQFKQAYDKTFLCKLMNSITLTVLSDLFNSFSVKFRDYQFTFISKSTQIAILYTSETIKIVLILSITYKIFSA